MAIIVQKYGGSSVADVKKLKQVADPRVVPAARRIGTISYEETQEMAEAGAKVLNAQAVEFAKDKGIAIYARATSGPLPGPDPSSDGTVVRKSAPRMPGTVVGVASERDVIVLEGEAAPGDLLALLDEHGVSGKQLHIAGARTHVVISRENLHDEARLRELLRSRLHGHARLVDGLAVVGITPTGTATSSFRISWMIPRDGTDAAVRALHTRLLETDSPLLP